MDVKVSWVRWVLLLDALNDWMVLAICLLYEAMADGFSDRKFLLNVGGLGVEGMDGVVLLVAGCVDFNLVVLLLILWWCLRVMVILTR